MTQQQIAFDALSSDYPLLFRGSNDQIWFAARNFTIGGLLIQFGTDTSIEQAEQLGIARIKRWNIHFVETANEAIDIAHDWMIRNDELVSEIKLFWEETL